MFGLTDRQKQALDFIQDSVKSRGYPPTLREIGAHMNIRSTNGVNDHLRALERKGYLKRPVSPRTGGAMARGLVAVLHEVELSEPVELSDVVEIKIYNQRPVYA